MTIQQKLRAFAYETAYPYLTALPEISAHREHMAFLLVGSVATGLCTEQSDVDICMVCEQKIFDALSPGTRWASGRPTELILDGTQLHYYAISTSTLQRKIDELDNLTFYVYGNSEVMSDTNGVFREISQQIRSDELMEKRREQALDMLSHRRLALHQVLPTDADPVARSELALELVRRLLVCIALNDGLQYDGRKRLYRTALLGPTGKSVKSSVDELLTLLGEVHDSVNRDAAVRFLNAFDRCYEELT